MINIVIDEHKINTMSRYDLQKALDELYAIDCMTDRQLYLYELIEKRIANIDKGDKNGGK